MLRYLLVILIFFSNLLFSQSGNQNSKDPKVIEINKYLKKSDDFINVNLDSALYYSKKANEIIDKLSTTNNKVDIFVSLGNIYLNRSNYVASLENYLKGAKIVESELLKNPKNDELLANKIHFLIRFGNVEMQQNNLNKASEYYNKAMLLLDEVKLKNLTQSNMLKLKILNNLAGVYSKKSDFRKSLNFIELARDINNKGVKDKNLDSHLLNNLGIAHIELGDFPLAIYYLEQSLQIRKSLNDQRGIAQSYNNLGEAYSKNKNYAKAESYFKNALEIGQKSSFTDSVLKSLESLSALYEKTNKTSEAFINYKAFTKLKDSLYNNETVKHTSQLEMNYRLERQKEAYDFELKQKEAQRIKLTIIYISVSVGLLLLLCLAGLWIYMQKLKIKNIELSKDKLELEHKNISLEKDKLKEEVAFQNREITSKMMFLLKKNELITNIGNQLIDLKKNASQANQKHIQDIITEVRQKKDNDVWTEFETYFTKVHPDFYSNLQKLYPDLTPNEKKLCAFLRLNMSTKDISTITYQSLNTITVSRSRLRKKLNIQGEDTNLNNFLMQL
ncbi:Tetratricopeptide repeat-containing protein [Soonwooa buanensis]|uniref:Tetratricopeptide repeat-containing protein n=1 Tax=Soonwooa buanensis TaxID=619805 RepID=A0A1T5FKZ0_9FLAO|nr:tetratricopeptide repeat protein [Soonwooa buanensis]SKB96815.1 Tetratricopeptide repeat-containing protein [Soonwooa buanensis]